MMPAQKEAAVPNETSSLSLATPSQAHAGKKILVIDDTPGVLTVLVETLTVFGFTTFSADSGRTGMRLAMEKQPDLIICDVRMPEMDGYATLKAVRQTEGLATTPFIFLSGAADKIDMRRGMDLGADDYLTKPFTPKELLAAVHTRLEKQAEAQRLSDKKLDELRGNITLALPHELRTPLHGIMGLANILMDDYATLPREEILESARFIHESALRLHRLIENFLVYSQIALMASESKKIEISTALTPVTVHEVIPELARKVALRYQREQDLKLEVKPGSILIPADNLTKIVEELVDNAFKFSEPGKPVQVATDLADNKFLLTITDHGRGMTAEQISGIGPQMQFNRKTYEQQGAGLGLIIAKRLTELLGGQFVMLSKPGEQTTVQVSFALPGV